MRQTPIYIMNDVQCEGGWGLGPPSNFISNTKHFIAISFSRYPRETQSRVTSKLTTKRSKPIFS